MLDLALLYPLPAAIAVMAVFLLLADLRAARLAKPVPVPVRARVERPPF